MTMFRESDHSSEVRRKALPRRSAIRAKAGAYVFIRFGTDLSVGLSFVYLPFL